MAYIIQVHVKFDMYICEGKEISMSTTSRIHKIFTFVPKITRSIFVFIIWICYLWKFYWIVNPLHLLESWKCPFLSTLALVYANYISSLQVSNFHPPSYPKNANQLKLSICKRLCFHEACSTDTMVGVPP